ncbi:MAG: HD domain-containing protein [Chitinophagales bacterium]|nr:HD domain-containing protein [Chitinophagales bacterium]
MNFHLAKKYILTRLKDELPSYLTYHGYHHTWDVYEMTIEIAMSEGITDEEDLTLLKTAAIFHDSGFILAYNGHEDLSCEIVREKLPEFDYNEEQIEKICSMIQATKIPQNPQTQLEEILADADLDYLGREDFYPISSSLFEEFKSISLLKTEEEWNKIQVKFLEQHHYFTKTCIQRRKDAKEKRLVELRKLIG